MVLIILSKKWLCQISKTLRLKTLPGATRLFQEPARKLWNHVLYRKRLSTKSVPTMDHHSNDEFFVTVYLKRDGLKLGKERWIILGVFGWTRQYDRLTYTIKSVNPASRRSPGLLERGAVYQPLATGFGLPSATIRLPNCYAVVNARLPKSYRLENHCGWCISRGDQVDKIELRCAPRHTIVMEIGSKEKPMDLK